MTHRIRHRRERLGLTQEQLGVMAGFRNPQPGVSQAERSDDRGNETATVLACAKALKYERWSRLAKRRAREHLRREAARIDFQRFLWTMIPASPEKAMAEAAMIERAFDLMCEGFGEECDAIAEWLPEPAVDAMFARWERDYVDGISLINTA